jgi:hypothetical protein
VSLAQAVAAVVKRLEGVTVGGAKVRVFTDPQDVAPPCLFLPPPSGDFTFGQGGTKATWELFIVAPTAGGNTPAFNSIFAIVDALVPLGLPLESMENYSLTLPSGNVAPAIRVTWPERIRIGV